MKRFLVLLVSILAFVLFGGCSSNDATSEERICDPGQYAVCICKNGNYGTRLCNGEGTAFSTCQLKGKDLCPGAEVPTDKDGNPTDGTGGKARDKCPGKPLTIDSAEITRVTADTTSGESHQNGAAGSACLAGANTNEHVYAITASEDGSLEVTMTPLAPLDGVLYARRGDCMTGAQVGCTAGAAAGGVETLQFNVIGGELYFVFADGKDGSKGSYTLDFSLDPGPFCGNGKIDQPSEVCDDGNDVPGDGCGVTCQPEGNPPNAGLCPGMPLIVAGALVTITGQKTVGYAATYIRQPGVCGAGTSGGTGLGSPDRVYAATAKRGGTMTVTTANASFDHQIYVRSDCADQNSQIVCASLISGTGAETAQFPVEEGKTYYVFIDGLITGSGTFDISFSIQ